MSGDNKSRGFSESLVLDDSANGVVIKGITDDTVAAKTGLQAGDEIVAATVHLNHLNKNDVLKILAVLEPYDNNVKVLTKKEVNARAGLGSFGLGLKDSAQMLNLDRDLALDASAEAPGLSLNAPSGNLNAANGLGFDISDPKLNGGLPDLSLNKSDAGADFSMPSLGLTGPDLKGDLGGTKSPNFNLSTPQVNAPSLNVKKPEMETGNLNYKAPRFTMPHFDLPQIKKPKAEMGVSGDLDVPSVSGKLDTPDLHLSSPKVASPDLNLNAPQLDLNGPRINSDLDADIEGPGKIKWPHLKVKGPKVKGAPDASLDLPNADLTGPNLHMKTPSIDAEAPSHKFVWPHKKWKKPKLNGPKADMDFDANLGRPDVDISGPKIDGNIPDVDVKSPNIDVEAPSGKLKWPTLKKPKWGVTRPTIDTPDADLKADISTPDLNLSGPNIDGKITAPETSLSLPKADLEAPVVDINGPDVEGPSGKLKWPTLKKPNWGVTRPTIDTPDADLKADISTPDLNLSGPNIDGKITAPEANLSLPKADLEAPVVDINGPDVEGPSGKFKWPTFKKPNWGVTRPTIDIPDADLKADVSTPDLNLSGPNIDGEITAPEANLSLPKADLEAPVLDINGPDVEGPSGKFKWPTFKKPKWAGTRPAIDIPDADLKADISTPDLNLSGPNIDGEITAPEANLNLPKADLDIDGPDIEGPSGKLKWLNLKKPKFGTFKGLKTDINVDPEVPNVDLETPDMNLSGESPDLSINMPKANVKDPHLQLNGPDVDLDSPDGKLNFPKFRLPKLKAKDPQLDANLKTPNIDAKAPDLSLSAPNIGGGFDAPDLDIGSAKIDPQLDLQVPEADVSAGKIKMPDFKLPKFGFGAKEPQFNIDTDLPDPKITGDFSTPDLGADLNTDMDLSAPKSNISLPKLNLPTFNSKGLSMNSSLPKVDANGPSFNMPKADFQASDFSLSSPTINAPQLPSTNVGINVPKAELEAPDAQFKTPGLDSNLGDFKMPNLNLPAFDLPNTQVSGPSVRSGTADASFSAPTLDVGVPKVEGDLKGPKIDLKAPNVDANLEKPRFPHFKLPKLNLGGSKVTTPDVDTSANLDFSPDVNLKAPGVEGGIGQALVSASAPDVNTSINTPELNLTADADAAVKDSHSSKIKWPFKWGLKSNSRTDDEDSDVNCDVDENDLEVPSFKIHSLPRNSISDSGGITDIFGLTKHDIESKDYMVSKGIRLPVVTPTAKTGEKIDIMERLKMAKDKAFTPNDSPTEAKADIDLNVRAPYLSASTEAQDSSLVRGGTFKVDKQDFDLGQLAPKISSSDENDKLSTGLANMLCLNSDAD